MRKIDMAILIIRQNDIRVKITIRGKEGHFIMIKGQIHQEEIHILSIYLFNNKVSKYRVEKWIGMKEETDKSITIN